jgi:hypothetical protein
MKNFILKLVFSRLGPSVTSGVSVATGFLLGWIVNATSALGMHLDAAQQTTVSLAISQTIYWLITELINKYAGEHAEAIQKAIGTKVVDRWIGPETIAAAQEAAQKAANPSTGNTLAQTGEPNIYQGLPVPPTPKPQPTKRKKRINPLKR